VGVRAALRGECARGGRHGALWAYGVDVTVGVGVNVGVAVLVGVAVFVGVGVIVGVGVGVAVLVGVGVDVTVGVGVGVTRRSNVSNDHPVFCPAVPLKRNASPVRLSL